MLWREEGPLSNLVRLLTGFSDKKREERFTYMNRVILSSLFCQMQRVRFLDGRAQTKLQDLRNMEPLGQTRL